MTVLHQAILTHFETSFADQPELMGADRLSRAVMQARVACDLDDPARNTAPHVRDMLPIVTDLPRLKALAFSAESIAEEVSGDTGIDAGTVILFEDGSFLRFEGDGELHGDHLDVAWMNPNIDRPFPHWGEIEIRAASIAFRAANGDDLAAWMDNLPDDEADEDIINAMVVKIADQIDPPIDSINMSPSQSWANCEAEALDEAIIDTWLGLGIPHDCALVVMSAVDDDPAFIELNFHDPALDMSLVLSRFETVLRELVDLDEFVGSEWEYADGAHDRVSGFSQNPVMVTSVEFERASYSNHEYVHAPNRLIARLEAKTSMGREEILAMLGRPEDFVAQAAS